MRKLILIAGFLYFFYYLPVGSQEWVSNRSLTSICYAGNKVNRIFIPPPKEFLNRSESKSGGTITVYYSGFSSQAKSAMEYAVGILESMLPPDLKMTVKASWTKISSSGVLGNSSITGYAAGWGIDAFEPYAYYPVTVAEKIAGKSINEDNEADVELVLNNTINWYFGTDGKTSGLKYDLVTVIIHELCHGLGFFDSMVSEDGSTGSYGIWGVPVIYDLFVENADGERLTDTLKFPQNSVDLYNQFTGGQLYFNGPLTKRYMSGVRPKLYSPSIWDPGSSISHLDETQTLAVNALMTPYIDRGEAIHDPGKLTSSILGDIGWINTRILPGEKKDSEDHLTELDFTAEIRSDTLYDKNNVAVVYSFDNFKSSDTLKMVPSATENHFSAKIGINSYNTRVDYYFYALDDFSRIFRSPSRGQKNPLSLYIGIDTIKPVITTTKADYFFEKVDTIDFNANVTDNLGLDTVYVEYRVNNGAIRNFGLSNMGEDNFGHKLNVKPELLKGGDTLKYHIIAIDKASGHNRRILPATGYYTIKIEAVGSAVRSYSTDFSNASSEFFNSGFEITNPSGFNSKGLHTEHPYQSPDKDYASLEFSSVLRHPVIFDESGMVISFRELVLVEPGAEGSIYGFSDFYDYVVIEGSKDFGKNWFILADGYDSRIISSWETSYNSSIDGQNSLFTGDESMMVTHTIYPKVGDEVATGDSVLIRFRLFSDPYANGWGWVIDDLEINPLVDHAEENRTGVFKLYPNPGKGLITILTDDSVTDNNCQISIYTISGQCIAQNKKYTGNVINLNISDYRAGLYLIMIKTDHGIMTVKYSLIK
jgi:hypothetical protein